MQQLAKKLQAIRPWLSKGWVQWSLATVIFFLLSWLYMGGAINDCSTATTAFNSDSTGGFGWLQWVGGNDLTWDYSNKSNFPYGESLDRPQFVTSTLVILIYKVLSIFSTPICGINLIVLLGYMSTALVTFGFIKWLLKRIDIALFAGYAAAFVPYHQFKATSHVTYIYGSVFIAIIWAYLWFLSKPSYKKVVLFSLVSAAGFYFDGYFILIAAAVIGSLWASSFFLDFVQLIFRRRNSKELIKESIVRLKYLMVSVFLLGLLLAPILYVYKSQGVAIRQSLATARSDIKVEITTYGVRPIEFLLPAINNPLMPDKYPAWRLTEKNQHYSNPTETTLYIGYTIIILALVAYISLFYRTNRLIKFRDMSYPALIFSASLVMLVSFALSLPAKATIMGHIISTPTALLAELTSNWRVLTRFFLVIDPLVILIASLGIYMVTKGWKRIWQIALVTVCGLILFLEYLPSPLGNAADLYKDSPEVYRQLRGDKTIDVMAEYPLADFKNSPSVFTYQQVHEKTLLNASNVEIMKGPLHASIAGLNDRQTLGALKKMGIDVVTTYGFDPKNPGLTTYFPNKLGAGGVYSYRINNTVSPRSTVLIISKGYESLSVDERQISHRAITGPAIMKVFQIWSGKPSDSYIVSFDAQTIVCGNSIAQITVEQEEKNLWLGNVGNTPVDISFLATADKPIHLSTTCSLDIINMSARETP